MIEATEQTIPARPSYRFNGKLPSALWHLRDKPCWVAWDYRWQNGKWSKPPINPRNGLKASVSNPATWTTYDAALAGMKKYGLAGVGWVLTRDDNLTGIDIDDCVSDANSVSEVAAEVIGYGETYAEISPSGEGIR